MAARVRQVEAPQETHRTNESEFRGLIRVLPYLPSDSQVETAAGRMPWEDHCEAEAARIRAAGMPGYWPAAGATRRVLVRRMGNPERCGLLADDVGRCEACRRTIPESPRDPGAARCDDCIRRGRGA